jgi:hypothetical protein
MTPLPKGQSSSILAFYDDVSDLGKIKVRNVSQLSDTQIALTLNCHDFHRKLSRLVSVSVGNTGCADGDFLPKRAPKASNRRPTEGNLIQMTWRFQLLKRNLPGLLEYLSVGECWSLLGPQALGGRVVFPCAILRSTAQFFTQVR